MQTATKIHLARHPDSRVDDADLTRIIPPFRKSYAYDSDHIDKLHAKFAASRKKMLVGPMAGSLRVADALKLYELAYFATGDILELGTYNGLSAWLMATALKRTRSPHRIVTIDLSQDMSDLARANIEAEGLADHVTFVTAEGVAGIRGLAAQDKRFRMAFIDHSHERDDVLSATLALPSVLDDTAPVAFHDYNEYRNLDPAFPGYGVIQGVRKARETVALEFCGIYGCLALYQYQAPVPANAAT